MDGVVLVAVFSLSAFAVSLVALCEIGHGAGTGSRLGARTVATLAAKLLGLELAKICIRCKSGTDEARRFYQMMDS
jgi:hypothetical protein